MYIYIYNTYIYITYIYIYMTWKELLILGPSRLPYVSLHACLG